MKQLNRKRTGVILIVITLVIVVGLFVGRPYVNRILDNREYGVVRTHVFQFIDAVQQEARERKSYPSFDRAEKILQSLSLINPHIDKPYQLVANSTRESGISDGQISYVVGSNGCRQSPDEPAQASIAYSANLTRVNEAKGGCFPMNLDTDTEASIQYNLSCETNWLGFTTGCDTPNE
jgi:hypothetical protein